MQRKYRDGSEAREMIKIFYDYMDYHSKYSHGENSLLIVQTAPHSHAPFYKVISGNQELNCLPGNSNVF